MLNVLPSFFQNNIFAYIELIFYMLIYLIFLFVIIYLIMFLLAWLIIPRDQHHKREAIHSLEEKYKKGEISKKTFLEKKEDIES